MNPPPIYFVNATVELIKCCLKSILAVQSNAGFSMERHSLAELRTQKLTDPDSISHDRCARKSACTKHFKTSLALRRIALPDRWTELLPSQEGQTSHFLLPSQLEGRLYAWTTGLHLQFHCEVRPNLLTRKGKGSSRYGYESHVSAVAFDLSPGMIPCWWGPRPWMLFTQPQRNVSSLPTIRNGNGRSFSGYCFCSRLPLQATFPAAPLENKRIPNAGAFPTIRKCTLHMRYVFTFSVQGSLLLVGKGPVYNNWSDLIFLHWEKPNVLPINTLIKVYNHSPVKVIWFSNTTVII